MHHSVIGYFSRAAHLSTGSNSLARGNRDSMLNESAILLSLFSSSVNQTSHYLTPIQKSRDHQNVQGRYLHSVYHKGSILASQHASSVLCDLEVVHH